jgi:hypothetical protein
MNDHQLQYLVYWFVLSVATGIFLPNRCPAMDYSASIRFLANACQFRGNQSVVSDMRLENCVLESHCIAMDDLFVQFFRLSAVMS